MGFLVQLKAHLLRDGLHRLVRSDGELTMRGGVKVPWGVPIGNLEGGANVGDAESLASLPFSRVWRAPLMSCLDGVPPNSPDPSRRRRGMVCRRCFVWQDSGQLLEVEGVLEGQVLLSQPS